MAAPAPPIITRLRINLLYPQGLPQKLSTKLLKWILSYGRIILIIVELVVLGTFLMRFKYDADLADLKEQIEVQVPYVQALAPDDALIRQTQFKLATIKKTLDFTPNIQQLITLVAQSTPTGVTFTSFNIENPEPNILSFRIVGRTTTNVDLGRLINNLKANQNITDVNITNIGLDEGSIIFTLTGNMKVAP